MALNESLERIVSCPFSTPHSHFFIPLSLLPLVYSALSIQSATILPLTSSSSYPSTYATPPPPTPSQVSRLREDSEADRHTKDEQCEQLTSELHRREDEYASAQQVWMRRVAQLERTLTSEGEHIKTILRQRDQLAVRKAGLDARVESLDTQVCSSVVVLLLS